MTAEYLSKLQSRMGINGETTKLTPARVKNIIDTTTELGEIATMTEISNIKILHEIFVNKRGQIMRHKLVPFMESLVKIREDEKKRDLPNYLDAKCVRWTGQVVEQRLRKRKKEALVIEREKQGFI